MVSLVVLSVYFYQ